MSLVKCPDCNRIMSSQTPACPDCARQNDGSFHPYTKKSKKRINLMIILSVAAVLLASSILLIAGRQPSKEDSLFYKLGQITSYVKLEKACGVPDDKYPDSDEGYLRCNMVEFMGVNGSLSIHYENTSDDNKDKISVDRITLEALADINNKSCMEKIFTYFNEIYGEYNSSAVNYNTELPIDYFWYDPIENKTVVISRNDHYFLIEYFSSRS